MRRKADKEGGRQKEDREEVGGINGMGRGRRFRALSFRGCGR